jgi:hypothetical protein
VSNLRQQSSARSVLWVGNHDDRAHGTGRDSSVARVCSPQDRENLLGKKLENVFPLCLEALYGPASRRGFVKTSVMAAAAVACGVRAASGAAAPTPAAQQPRNFTNILDLTNPLYEGFPTLDGSLV